MTEPHKIQCFARVARPYESVRAGLHRLRIAGGAPLSIHSIFEQKDVAGLPASTRVTLAIEDDGGPEAKHVDSAEIYASALSPFETQIEVECHCVASPGTWADTKGSATAEAQVRALLDKIVDRIRRESERPGEPSNTAW